MIFKSTIRDLFDRLEAEQEQPEKRKIHVESTPKLDELIKIYESGFHVTPSEGRRETSSYYEHFGERLIGLHYTTQDVELFSLKFQPQEHRSYFPFLTAAFFNTLTYLAQGKKVTIHTHRLETYLPSLGEENSEKEIIISGPAGESLGLGMIGGTITVHGDCIGRTRGIAPNLIRGSITIHGNVSHQVATVPTALGTALSDATITVNGDVRGMIGYRMSGGVITINGNASGKIGYKMRRGTIHINGPLKPQLLPEERGKGNIYWRGTPLVKNGELVA